MTNIQSFDYQAWPLVRDYDQLSLSLKIAEQVNILLSNAYQQAKTQITLNADGSDFTPYDEQAEEIAAQNIRQYDHQAKILSEELYPDAHIDLNNDTYWLIDGIDGTSNFARRIPFCNFTMAYVEKGVITIGIDLDFVHHELFYTVKDKGAFKNGQAISICEHELSESLFDFAMLPVSKKVKAVVYERQMCSAVKESWFKLQEHTGRFPRQIQSGALELAYVADGCKFDAYIVSWTRPWDWAASALLVREAGGKVTTIFGNDWQPSYEGVIAAPPKIHTQILPIVQAEFKKAILDSKENLELLSQLS
jgi:myo-inositol-1(or 4)-monophosphatase